MPLYLNGRIIEYTNQVIYEEDFLRTNLYNMTGVSKLAQTILGTGVANPNYLTNDTLVAGLNCIPVSPPGLAVTIQPGVIYSMENLDNTDYGVLPADTDPNHQLYKQGMLFDPQNFNTPAPVTAGQSIYYLVEAILQTNDYNDVSRPYFNPASTPTNPLPPIFNDNFDTRTDIVALNLVTGIAGVSPSPPAPTAGYTPLWNILVANGQTTIISGDINIASGASFITESLTQKISQATADARYFPLTNTLTKVRIANGASQTCSSGSNTLTTVFSGAQVTGVASWWDVPSSSFIIPANLNNFAFVVVVNLDTVGAGGHFLELYKNGSIYQKFETAYTDGTSISLSGYMPVLGSSSGDAYQFVYNNGSSPSVDTDVGGQNNEMFVSMIYLGQ